MSTLGRDIGRSLVMAGGLVYLVLLAAALILLRMSPELVLGMTVTMFGLLAMALNPLFGIHAFLALLYVENALPYGEGLTVIKVLGGVIFAGWLLNMAMQRKMPLRMDGLTLLVLLFLSWTGISVIYAFYTEPALSRVFTFAQLSAATLMVSSVVDTPAKIRGVYWGIVLWSLFSTVVAIAWYAMGVTPFAIGLIGNRNGLAAVIDVAIVCAYLLHQATASGPARHFLAATLPVFIFGLALTFSRTGLIMLLVALLCVWYRVLVERKLLVLVGSMIMICIIALLLPPTFWLRASTILPAIERQEGTFGQRIDLWEVAMRMIEDRPVTGVGPGNFAPAFARYARGEMMMKTLDAHNSYLSVASQMGLVGLGLFLLLYVAAMRHALRAARIGRETRLRELELYAHVLLINLILFLTESVTGSSETHKGLWIFFGLAASLGRMAQERFARTDQPASGALQGEPREGSEVWSLTPSKRTP